MILMRIKNVDPKGWYDIPGYDGLYQINYWGNVRKRLKYGCYKQLHPYVKASEEFHQMPYAIRKRTKKEGESDGKKR